MLSGSPVSRYGAAAVAVLVTLGIRLALDPVLGQHAPYLPFALAIVFAARFGGRGPGLAATVLSTVSVMWFFIEPRHSFPITNPNAVAGLALFAVVGSLISVSLGRLRESLLSLARAEQMLRRQTQLIGLSHDAIVTTDPDRRIIGWNAGAEEMYGWTKTEAAGSVTHKLLQTTGLVTTAQMDEILRREGQWNGELSHVTRDGRRLVVDSRQVLLRDEQNRPAGILSINRDITARKQAEEALRDSERRYSALFGNKINAIAHCKAITDADGKPIDYEIIEVNHAYESVTGITKANVEGKRARQVFPGIENFSFDYIGKYGRVALDGGELAFEIFFESLKQWLSIYVYSPKRGEFVAIFTDVTGRKQSEERLRESESFYRQTLESIPGMVFTTRPDGYCDYQSEQWVEYTGVPMSEHVGAGWNKLLHPDDRARAFATWQAAVEGRAPYDLEYRVRRHDGAYEWFKVIGRPIRDAAGQIVRWFGVALNIEELKRAEAGMREALEHRNLAMEAANLGAWDYRLDRGDVFWDERSWNIFGVTGKDRIDYPDLMGRIHAADRAATDKAINEAIAGANGGAYHREFRVVWPDGSVHWVAGHGRVFFEGDGDQRRAVRFVGVNMEVTERRRAEQALRDSEQRYRALFESIQEGFVLGEVICDAAGNPIDWRYLEVNPAMASMLRHKRNEVVGRTYRELFPEAPWQYWVAGFGQVALTGTPARLDHYGGGTGRHYDAIAYSPAPGQFAAILTDITERKRTEQALARQKQQYETLAENAPEVIARFDSELRHVYINDYGAKVYGIPKPEILGKTNAELGFPADKVAFWKKHFDETFTTGKQQTAEFEFDSPNLGRQHLSSIFVPEIDEHGHVSSILAITRDVTGQKQADERLRETQKLESIGLLAGGVAHDFNNLLTVIMGSASSALDQCPSCEHSQAILSASERAAYLTKQLLAYAGKGQAVLKIVDLTELVSQSTGLISASIPKRVSLRFNLSKGLPCLEADPSRIEQILMNFVINAGESIPPKSDGLIEITTSSCEVTPHMARQHSKAYDVAAGSFVCLEVRDNGAGMDGATLSRIFDPFFSTKFTGRGLGLAAVHGIVRTSKGFIDVHSLPGAGTTFRVFLPASEKTSSKEFAPTASEQPSRGYATILVVDDEEMVRKLACMTLRRYGYDVLEAKDGRDALQVLADSPALPSLILLDLAMPVMGGDELVPILNEKYPGLKIIVSSGYAEEDARKGFGSGSIVGFLQKPYTIVTLAEKVREALAADPSRNGQIIEFPRTR